MRCFIPGPACEESSLEALGNGRDLLVRASDMDGSHVQPRVEFNLDSTSNLPCCMHPQCGHGLCMCICHSGLRVSVDVVEELTTLLSTTNVPSSNR